MTEPLGRRAASKQATRTALERAAKALFAERGVAGTTVRDIADAAGVTERTFFRYFAGKEELILDDVLAWLPTLQAAIVARPTAEEPLRAVIEATKLLFDAASQQGAASPLDLFVDGRPINRLGVSTRGFLLRIEVAVAAALFERLVGEGARSEDEVRYEAETSARVSLAISRSALIRDTQLRESSRAGTVSLNDLLDEALRIVGKHPQQRRAL